MQIKNLTMSFGTQILFEDVNLNIPENEKVGLVGVNGAGKTTLFKIIIGFEYPDSGNIILKNGTRVSWLPQVITDDIKDLNINVLDYLMLGTYRLWKINWQWYFHFIRDIIIMERIKNDY